MGRAQSLKCLCGVGCVLFDFQLLAGLTSTSRRGLTMWAPARRSVSLCGCVVSLWLHVSSLLHAFCGCVVVALSNATCFLRSVYHSL